MNTDTMQTAETVTATVEPKRRGPKSRLHTKVVMTLNGRRLGKGKPAFAQKENITKSTLVYTRREGTNYSVVIPMGETYNEAVHGPLQAAA